MIWLPLKNYFYDYGNVSARLFRPFADKMNYVCFHHMLIKADNHG